MTYSSTTLSGPEKSGCWRQLDFSEENAPSLFPLEYRSYLGQAAHAVMQYCAERRDDTEEKIRATAEEVGDLLIGQGRTFRGHAEPPMPADDVWLGVDVAVKYLLGRGLPTDAEKLWPEQDWEHPTMPYRALIDLVAVYEEGDEEYGQRVLDVTDYKTSWQADEGELDTLQRWGQAVVMWRNLETIGPADIIRQRVVNLRTWQEYTRDINLNDPDDIAELEQWERRINSLCMTAHHNQSPVDGRRPAAPGVGCLSCAYRHICEEVECYDQSEPWTPEQAATNLAKVEALRKLFINQLKEHDPEDHVKIEGGWVGFKEQPMRVFAPGKEKDILDEWLTLTACDIPDEAMPVLVSLLAALKLGKDNLDGFAKALMPERAKGIVQARANYVETFTVEKRQSRFGVWDDE